MAGVLIAGASLGGLRAAEQLRSAGFDGTITVVGDEPHPPYNRPPLSKQLLSTAVPPADALAQVAFRQRSAIADVDFVLGRRVTGVDLAAGSAHFDDGSTTGFAGLVVATGLRPRRLPLPGPTAGRFALRTLDDCLALRARLRPGTQVVVAGAGFIGCEVAATAASLGCRVTVVDPAGGPMQRVLGADVAAAVQRHHEGAGIAFRHTGLAAVEGSDHIEVVTLTDGDRLPADVLVEAVGSIPNTDWLTGIGLDTTDGVLCDNTMRAVGAEAVVAVGDVARFPNPLFDDVARRVEHWSIPGDTARRAAVTLAAVLAGHPVPRETFVPVPAFWSDQGALRLQSYGAPALADEVRLVEGEPDDPAAGLLAVYHRAGAHVGSVAINLSPARHRELRETLTGLVPAA